MGFDFQIATDRNRGRRNNLRDISRCHPARKTGAGEKRFRFSIVRRAQNGDRKLLTLNLDKIQVQALIPPGWPQCED